MKHKSTNIEKTRKMIYSYVYHLDLVGKYIKVSISQLSHGGKSFSYNKRGKKRTKGIQVIILRKLNLPYIQSDLSRVIKQLGNIIIFEKVVIQKNIVLLLEFQCGDLFKSSQSSFSQTETQNIKSPTLETFKPKACFKTYWLWKIFLSRTNQINGLQEISSHGSFLQIFLPRKYFNFI